MGSSYKSLFHSLQFCNAVNRQSVLYCRLAKSCVAGNVLGPSKVSSTPHVFAVTLAVRNWNGSLLNSHDRLSLYTYCGSSGPTTPHTACSSWTHLSSGYVTSTTHQAVNPGRLSRPTRRQFAPSLPFLNLADPCLLRLSRSFPSLKGPVPGGLWHPRWPLTSLHLCFWTIGSSAVHSALASGSHWVRLLVQVLAPSLASDPSATFD